MDSVFDSFFNHDLQIMIENKAIQSKITAYADKLNNKYKNSSLLIICILNGAVPFLEDLCNNLTFTYETEYIKIHSYEGMNRTVIKSSANKMIEFNPRDKNILIIDDICDSGHTLKFIVNSLNKYHPKSIATTVLLNKSINSKVFNADTSLFDIPDKFVVGYGLDYQENYRSSKNIYTLNLISKT